MRDFLDIIQEAVAVQQNQDGSAADTISGAVDAAGMAKLLSKVTDQGAFTTAIANLKSGMPLTAPMRAQLALAFISLLGSDVRTREAVMNKMLTTAFVKPVQASTDGPQQGPARN